MPNPEINWHRIERTWNGAPARDGEQVRVGLAFTRDALIVHVDAPFHGDPPPGGAAGRTDRLWEYEVVEVFLLGAADGYLELEVAPHRHLFLEFAGSRNRVADDVPGIVWTTTHAGDPPAEGTQAPSRWSGRLRVPSESLPDGALRWNAFACHGRDEQRRMLALHPSDLPAPDFHALRFYAPLSAPSTLIRREAERPPESITRTS